MSPPVRCVYVYCLEVSVGAVPRNTKKARNAKKAAGKFLREEGFILGRRVPSGRAESEAGHYSQVIP